MKKGKSISMVVLATILFVVLCTWIFPSASFDSSLVEGERVQAGLFDLFSYPMVAVTYFGYVLVYVLAVSMFYGIANKIPAYHVLIEKIKKIFTGKEALFLAIVIILIAVIVSVSGFSFGMIFVFPFVISVVLAMGYNKLVAASVTVGSVMAGIAGTTLGTSTVSYMNSIMGLENTDEMISKIIVLVVFLIVLVANVLLYAKKTKSTVVEAKVSGSKIEAEKETKSNGTKRTTSTKKATKTTGKAGKTSNAKTSKTKGTKANMAKNSDEVLKVKSSKEKKEKCWPFVLVFDLLLIILIMSVFDWSGLFEITWFSDAYDAITEFEIGGFPIFSKLLGTFYAFGSWSFNIEIPATVMIGSLILTLVYRVKWSDVKEGIESGIKGAIKPGLLMLLTYMVLIIVVYHPFQLVITKAILELTSGLNVVTMMIVALIASFFNVDIIYVAQTTLPYVMSIVGDAELYPLIQIIFQAGYGLAMLVVPTSIVLVGTLAYLDIPYGQWLKHIWKIFVELLIILLIIFLIILAI